MNQEFSNVPEPPKKKNTALIVVGVVAALLLCCCLLAVGAFALLGPAVGSTFESIERDLSAEGIPPEAIEEMQRAMGLEPEENPRDDFVPSGGLGDDTLRFDTWVLLKFGALSVNCVIPEDAAPKTTISVVQYPDNDGVWVERWNTPCEGGEAQSFTITFTPVATGGTDISIQSDE